MKKFKDFVENDNKVFFNLDEFGEIHTIADEECNIVFIDNGNSRGNVRIDDDYTNSTSFSFIVLKKDIGFRPQVDVSLRFDNRLYTVTSVIDKTDNYEITLEINEGWLFANWYW